MLPDVVMRQARSALPATERASVLQALRQTYAVHIAYLEQTGDVQVRDDATQGLALPAAVLDQIYHQNALAWYPQL